MLRKQGNARNARQREGACRMASGNASLGSAKKAKNDEFYTQYADIESEMNAYYEYDKDVFRGKTVLCPCDDPEWSNFTKYFASNFERFGLRKLICTSYAKGAGNGQITLFEKSSPLFDEGKHESHGKLYVLIGDRDGSGRVDQDDIEFSGYLEGDGDFRSAEVTELLREADVVATNPPFSLFREFLAWVMGAGKKFAIIGNQNVITYKEVFPLLKDNEMWLGEPFLNGNAFFMVPEGANTASYAKGVFDPEAKTVHFRNCKWFTNLDHGRRHEPLMLDTMEHNLKFNKKLRRKLEDGYGKAGYPEYDNYDAIEVPYVEAIPSDYGGAMGVPITFLDKYNPEQFEILGYTAKDMGVECLKFYEELEQSLDGKPFQRNMKSARFSPMVSVSKKPTKTCYRAKNAEAYLLKTYGRIIIRNKHPE